MKEVFEVFLNKGVVGSFSVELLVIFCDNIFKKGGSEKFSDEVIEDLFEKVFCFEFRVCGRIFFYGKWNLRGIYEYMGF